MVSEAHREMLLQSHAVRLLLQPDPSTSSADTAYVKAQQRWLPWHSSGGFLGPLQAQTSPTDDAVESTRATVSFGNSNTRPLSRMMLAPEPASSLELLADYLPELYTVEERFPTSLLAVTSLFETCHSGESRTNVCKFSYFRSRRWRTLDISIDIRRSSLYWAVTKLPRMEDRHQDALLETGMASLSPSLFAQIQSFLSTLHELEGTHLHFRLTDQKIIRETGQVPPSYPLPLDTNTFVSPDVLAFLDDLGCPRYVEEQLTQIAFIDPPTSFASCLGGKWVLETKFGQTIPTVELLYNIQLLRAMENTPGFVKFAGVVTDASGKRLSSYLIEFPWTRCRFLKDIFNETESSEVIPWERRERWARQIVEAVGCAHSKGFVIGTLGLAWRFSILIDHMDCVCLWQFKSKIVPHRTPHNYTPELHGSANTGAHSRAETGRLDITSKTDLYNLGRVLWLLAEFFPWIPIGPTCVREECIQFPHRCNRSHEDPHSLPPLPPAIPQYYRDMVDMCRAESPTERPAAWRLLRLFPLANRHQSSPEAIISSESLDSALLKHSSLRFAFCDHCGRPVESLSFTCTVCHSGDFDVCLLCFNEGRHCLDTDHLLVELEKRLSQGCAASGRYYSNVKDSGDRNVIRL